MGGGRALGERQHLLPIDQPGSSAFFFFFFFFFLAVPAACAILVPPPGIELAPSAVRAQGPNHWTAREIPGSSAFRGN